MTTANHVDECVWIPVHHMQFTQTILTDKRFAHIMSKIVD